MNKKKTYIAPAILLTIVCPDLNILAGSVQYDSGNCDFSKTDADTDGGEFKSKLNISDVWE